MTTGREPVRERLEAIAAANGGRLTAEAVVDDARDPLSPLHEHFEWNVKKAAYSFWLDQARSLIRSVRVEVHTTHSVIRSVAFVRDPAARESEQGYVAVSQLRADRELARSALVTEFGRVGDNLRRARELAVALDVVDDVDELIDRIVGLRRRVMEQPAQAQ